MDDQNCSANWSCENCDGEEEFQSCCAEDEEWKEAEESVLEGHRDDDLDEFSVKMFFKGVSVCGAEGSSTSGVSGIGVVLERSHGVPVVQVQKKLDFYVESPVAEYLALLDGLLEALRSGVRRVFAFTDSEVVNDQIAQGVVENQLLVALGQRIMEHADKLEEFVVSLVPSSELQEPLHLAQEATGIFHLFQDGDGSFEDCSICYEKKHSSKMVTMNCSHKFCSHCVIIYVQGQLQASQVPVRCPQLRCGYYILPSECKSFLPVDCYESFERTLVVAEMPNSERIRCPFSNCSELLLPDRLTIGENSTNPSGGNCIECPECHRLVCIDCGVPWHLSMTCEEYQNLPVGERTATDATLRHLANDNNWRRCQQCRRIIERTEGCSYMTCCHEFCYSCGAEYRDGQQTCQCSYLDENYEPPAAALSNQDLELWRWEFFDSPTISTYTEQERSQLALVQRFLAEGFGLGDQNAYQSPPRCADSYADTIKDLHQLPWLERFVSVISDNYHEDYTQ